MDGSWTVATAWSSANLLMNLEMAESAVAGAPVAL